MDSPYHTSLLCLSIFWFQCGGPTWAPKRHPNAAIGLIAGLQFVAGYFWILHSRSSQSDQKRSTFDASLIRIIGKHPDSLWIPFCWRSPILQFGPSHLQKMDHIGWTNSKERPVESQRQNRFGCQCVPEVSQETTLTSWLTTIYCFNMFELPVC